MEINSYIEMLMQSTDSAFMWFSKFIYGETMTLLISVLAFQIIVRFIVMPIVQDKTGSSDGAKKIKK